MELVPLKNMSANSIEELIVRYLNDDDSFVIWEPPLLTYAICFVKNTTFGIPAMGRKGDQRHFSSSHQQHMACPVGLEPLWGLTSLDIQFASALDFDSSIKSPAEEILYTSHNDMVCCDCTGESRREFLISDRTCRPVMQFIRTNIGCFRSNWSSETMVVQAPAGTEIGRVHINPGLFYSSYTLTDPFGRELASFERVLGFLKRAYVFTAPISGGKRQQIGKMDHYYVCASIVVNLTFDNVTDYRLKVLMIASAYLVAVMRRERRNE